MFQQRLKAKWRNGIRTYFKNRRSKGHMGSTPILATMHFIIENNPNYQKFKEAVMKHLDYYEAGAITKLELVYQLSQICELKATTVAGGEHCKGENANSTNEGLVE